MGQLRVGIGYDVHALGTGRTLHLGGVTIPYDRGLIGDSDADVLLHAIMDALLGAAGLGDLGSQFPPGDPRFKNARSLDLLPHVLRQLQARGWQIGNVDSTVIAQEPGLAPHIPAMRQALAEAMGVELGCVSIKATTPDRLGAIGRTEGIAAQAVVLLAKEGGLCGRFDVLQP